MIEDQQGRVKYKEEMNMVFLEGGAKEKGGVKMTLEFQALLPGKWQE